MTVRRLIVPAWAAALTALLLWPLRHTGYPLGNDLVFTPRQPLDAAAFGVSSAPPRAVPVDVLVALSERIVDGAVVGRLALALPLLLAGVGTARLLSGAPLAARLVASGFAIWNPYVVERLGLGQWSLLWGYAALPWLVAGLRAVRTDPSGRPRATLVVPLAAASITPTGGVLAVLVTAVDGVRRGRWSPAPLALAVVLQLPWLVAAAVSSGSTVSDPASAAAFASRDELGGVAVSLLGLGGIWNADVVPMSREGVLSLVAVVVFVAAIALGARRLHERLGPDATRLAVCAGAGFVLAVAPSVPLLDDVQRWVVSEVPGGGLLRDAQKWLAPLVVLQAVLLGTAVERIAIFVGRARPARLGLLAAALAVPLALLPDATRSVHPTVTPVHYPAGYATAAGLIDGPGDVAVLPFQPYRGFAWAGGRTSFDPAARLLDATVVTGDRLQVGTTLLAGEDPRAATVDTALRSGAQLPARLAGAGIGWVLVERGTPGAVPPLTGLTRTYRDTDVALYRVPGPVDVVHPSTGRVVAAVAAHVLWLGIVLAALLVAAGSAVRRRARPEPAQDLQGEPDR